MLIECCSLQAWAVYGGTEVIANNFYDLVPDMALDFPFELDTFQKEVSTLVKFAFTIYLHLRICYN